MSNTTPAGAEMQQEQHEQLQQLLGEYQDLYLEAQRQRDALAAELAAVRAELSEATVWGQACDDELAAVRAERDEWMQNVNELDSSLAQSAYAADDLREQLEAVRAEPRYVPVEDGFSHTETTFQGRHTERISVTQDWLTVAWKPESGEEYKASVQLPDNLRLCRLVPGQDTQPTQEDDNA